MAERILKLDKMTIVAIILIFLAGVIISQGFSFEVKLSDLIALFATLITFTFAWRGLKHNERQFSNSIQPVIEKMEYFNSSVGKYRYNIKNYGSGTAINLKYKILFQGKELTQSELANMLKKELNCSISIGGPLGMSPNDSHDLMNLDRLNSKKQIQKLYHLFSFLRVELAYSTTQGQVLVKELYFGKI